MRVYPFIVKLIHYFIDLNTLQKQSVHFERHRNWTNVTIEQHIGIA